MIGDMIAWALLGVMLIAFAALVVFVVFKLGDR